MAKIMKNPMTNELTRAVKLREEEDARLREHTRKGQQYAAKRARLGMQVRKEMGGTVKGDGVQAWQIESHAQKREAFKYKHEQAKKGKGRTADQVGEQQVG